METQFGGRVAPLGFDRLKVVEWLQALVQLKNPEICKKIEELQFPLSLLKLMSAYEMNSFLHLKVYGVFVEAIATGMDDYIKTVFLRVVIP